MAFVARFAGHWRSDIVGKAGVDVRVAPAMWVSDDFADDVELMTTYGAQVLYHGTSARVGAGLSGRVIVTGDGDFGEKSTHQFEAAGDFLAHNRWTRETGNAIRECAKPVIAAVNGPALGAGMGLMSACDIFLASDDARLCTGHNYFVDAGWR